MPELTQAPAPATKPAAKPHHRDSLRETAETVVFVVGLVLMLKLFVVEAFVIPTGSMAETLLGYNKVATCPECGYRFPINASDEAEPPAGQRYAVVGGRCPNCRHSFTFNPADAPPYRSGDRVLVHKALYHFEPPQRGDVVVFKYPVDPQVKQTAQNYIKRLWGLGGETIGISRGDLYRTTALTYDPAQTDADGRPLYPRPTDPNHAWERGPEIDARISKTDPPFRPDGPDYTYHNIDAAIDLFAKSRPGGFADPATGFELIRKTDSQMTAMRRIVYDNAHQPKSAAKVGLPPRWAADGPAAGWTPDDPAAPKAFAHAGDGLGWVRYKHRAEDPANPWGGRDRLPRAETFPPEKITHAMGYNSFKEVSLDRSGRPSAAQMEQLVQSRGRREEEPEYWVGDLILECSATLQSADAEVVLELSKGPHRYQAEFKGGQVRLIRTGPQGKELATRPTPMTDPGTYSLRFANVDCRLRVWVNDTKIDFGSDADYPPDGVPAEFDPADSLHEGWVRANDIDAPASVGAKGGVTVGSLVLWRDTYFTPTGPTGMGIAAHADTFYVHPQHHLCLGDNSAQSSDGRMWGLVPGRLLLGKAAVVFWPGPLQTPSLFQPGTWTLRWGDNRVGMIR
jgi:signal peptidase I